MSKLSRAFQEDRSLRDAAKRLVENDWRNITSGYSQRGVGQRLVDRMEEGAVDLAEDAQDFVEEHPAKVGTGVIVALAAALGWAFRDAISETMQDWWDKDWF